MERPLRSAEDTMALTVTFTNQSSIPIKLYWINYQGTLTWYEDIEQGQSYDMDTYIGHPWLFTAINDTPLGVFFPSNLTPNNANIIITGQGFTVVPPINITPQFTKRAAQ
jgi:hypothetical protein